MSRTAKTLLFWTPRILTVLFALFLVLFSFDVMGRGHGFWITIAAFMIHNIPTIILLLALWLTWRHEWVGAAFYILLGVAYVVTGWGRFPFVAFLAISGPLLLVGVLFLLNWIYRADLRPTSSSAQPSPEENQSS